MRINAINWNAASKPLPPGHARRLGWVMLACGVFLTWMMGGLIVWFTWLLLNNGPDASTTFEGGAAIAAFVYGLFAFVFAFGVAALKAGIHQVRHDRRDPSAVRWAGAMMVFLSGAGVLLSIMELVLDL